MFLIIELSFLISSLCFKKGVHGVEFTLNITEPTTEVCEELIPPHPPERAEGKEKYFQFSARWTSIRDVMLYVLNDHQDDTTIKGYIMQGRMNGKPVGTFKSFPGFYCLDCPPGNQNTLTGFYPNGESSVVEFWKCPADLEAGYNITFHVTVLGSGGKYNFLNATISSGGRSEVGNVVKQWEKGNENVPLPT